MNNVLKLPTLKHQIVSIIFLILISFGGSIFNKYSLDDEYVTTPQHKNVAKGFGGILDVLTTPYISNSSDHIDFEYRPITQISFAIEKEIFGFNTGVSHLINIVLYILLVLLIFKLLRTLFPQEYEFLTFLIMLIFALHPLHSEVVLSLKNREELLVSIFGFLSLYLVLKSIQQKRQVLLIYAVGLLGLGVLTKISITPFVFIIPFTVWFFKGYPVKKSILLFTVSILFMFAVRVLPEWYLGISNTREVSFIENPLFHLPFWDRLPMAFYSLYTYVKLHIIPHPLISFYGYNEVPMQNWFDYEVILGLFFASVFILIFCWFYKKNKLLSYGIGLFTFFMMPFLNFPIPAPGIIAERFSFNAVLGFAIAVIVLLEKISHLLKYKHFTLLFVSIAVVLYTAINFNRTPEWKSKLSLIENDARKAKNSYKLQAFLGDLNQEQISKTNVISEKRDFFMKTLKAYQKAAAIYEKDPSLFNNIGTTYFIAGDYQNAITIFEKAIELGADKALHYYHLGAAYEKNSNIIKAKYYYLKALEKDPTFEKAKIRLSFLIK